MNKQTTPAGPTGFSWVRSLLTFRHRNPIGRLVSTLLAFAIAALLVVSTGPAYADDTEPAPADTSAAADPTPDPSTSDPADPPADDPAPADDSSAPDTSDTSSDTPAATGDAGTVKDSGDAAAPAGSGTHSGPVMTTLKTLAKASVTPNLVGNATCQDTPNTMVGGFEIDGDPCEDEGGIDFLGNPDAASVDDLYQSKSDDIFTGGSSEGDNPATWSLTTGSPPGKADIGTAWAWSHTWHNPDPNAVDPTDGHVFAYFGFTNDSTSGGTQDYSLEYDQADPVNGRPVRTPGDLLFDFISNGSNALVYDSSFIYTDASDPSWNNLCDESGNLGAGWCPFTLAAGDFTSAESTTGEYVEGAIDITNLFGAGTCSPTFGTTFLRSAPGSFFTSELKDYVAPLGVTTPSTCGSLVIRKTDASTGELVPGAVFGITGDPRPGGDPADTYCVFDGVDADLPPQPAECDIYEADGTADGVVTIPEVEPGSYTVTELVAPPGYLLNPEPDPGNSQDATVGEGEQVTLTFANHKQWQPLDISKTADGTFGALYTWDITKQISANGVDGWSDHPDANDPLVKDIEAGGDTNLYYRVQVTEESVTPSNYVVAGTIHVDNPNDASVNASISESLTGCTLDSNDAPFPVDVAVPSGGADYDYTCNLGDGPEDPGTNTATVTWDKSDYPQSVDDLDPNADPDHFTDTGSDGYTFAETSTDKTITVTDDHFDFDPAWVITWGDEADGTYDSGVYSFDTQAETGTCSDVITNTATITGDNEAVLGQTSENGQVCVEADLTASVTADQSLTRTFPWDIDKSTTTPTLTNTNGSVKAHYKVIVTALPYVDSNWAMSGTVTVNNPNDFTDEQVSALDVAYSGGGTCSLDDPLPNVLAGSFSVVDFHCDFADAPVLSGDVTATVEWDAGAKSVNATPSEVTDDDWALTLVDPFVKVFDDHAVPGNEDPLFGGTQLSWQDVFDSTDPADHQVAVEYDYTFSGSVLPAAGACKSFTNTAWVIGVQPQVARALAAPEDALASDDATVRVCTPAVAPPVIPPEVVPPSLPNTGGPNVWYLGAGLALLLAGGALVIGDLRRRRRS